MFDDEKNETVTEEVEETQTSEEVNAEENEARNDSENITSEQNGDQDLEIIDPSEAEENTDILPEQEVFDKNDLKNVNFEEWLNKGYHNYAGSYAGPSSCSQYISGLKTLKEKRYLDCENYKDPNNFKIVKKNLFENTKFNNWIQGNNNKLVKSSANTYQVYLYNTTIDDESVLNECEYDISNSSFYLLPNGFVPNDLDTLNNNDVLVHCNDDNTFSIGIFDSTLPDKIFWVLDKANKERYFEDFQKIITNCEKVTTISKIKSIFDIKRILAAMHMLSIVPSGNKTKKTKSYRITNLNADDIRNLIFYGAPGTGKSYLLNQRKDLLINAYSKDNFERVTFHSEYRYSDFVGTYKPVSIKDPTSGLTHIEYKFVPGPFLRLYIKAKKAPTEKFVLIIEEINRANVSGVFGDIFQLLDRDSNGKSQYTINTSEDIKEFFIEEGLNTDIDTMEIPSNMYIWATMNSADQGVNPMDTAFKRRWDFEYIDIDNEENDMDHNPFDIGGENITWNDIRHEINKNLSANNINEDKQLGPHFISKSDLASKDKFINAFKNKVIMYLYEDGAKRIRSKIFINGSFSEIRNSFSKKGAAIFAFHNTDKN